MTGDIYIRAMKSALVLSCIIGCIFLLSAAAIYMHQQGFNFASIIVHMLNLEDSIDGVKELLRLSAIVLGITGFIAVWLKWIYPAIPR